MSQKTRPGGYYSKAALCELLGISRNGYYKHEERETEFGILVTSVVMYCRWVRLDDHLPKSGCRELLILCREYFGDKFRIGRDRFSDGNMPFRSLQQDNGIEEKTFNCEAESCHNLFNG